MGPEQVSKDGSDKFCQIRSDYCPDTDWDKYVFDKVDDEERKIVYMNHYPAGISVKNYIHYAQIIRDRRFQAFDYGIDKNQETYNSDTPTEIDLLEIKLIPYSVWEPSYDKLSSKADNYWASEQLYKNRAPGTIFY